MCLSRSLASLTAAVALVMTLPYAAMPHPRVKAGKATDQQPFGSACWTTIRGSRVVAYCHNPYVETDRVRLHVECARWWDVDTDSAPEEAGPAMTVRLTGRCWKEVRTVWISHENRGS